MYKESPEVMNDMDGESSIFSLDTITENIKLNTLPFFEQAAVETGYELKELAKEDEPYTFLTPVFDTNGNPTSERVITTIILKPGEIAIAIKKPMDQIDHSLFGLN